MSEKTRETTMTTAAAKERRAKKRKAEAALSKTKHCVMNKMTSGSEDICPRSTEEKDEHAKNKEVTFIILNKKKNMKSTHSSEKNPRIGLNSRVTDVTRSWKIL